MRMNDLSEFGRATTRRMNATCASSSACEGAVERALGLGPLYCASATPTPTDDDGGYGATVEPTSTIAATSTTRARENGACRPCEECARYGDEISRRCPTSCDEASASANATADVFFNDYDYWNSIAEREGGHAPKGCAASARATTTGAVTIRRNGDACAEAYTKRDPDRWCDAAALTRTAPYGGCVATASTNYCGTGVSEFCLGRSYFDCCPIKPVPLAFTVIGGTTFLVLAMFLAVRRVYARKLAKMRAAGEALRFVYRLKHASKWRAAARKASADADTADDAADDAPTTTA